MNISLSMISDIMLVLTLPLMGILGIWEHNLSITDTNHELVQIVLVFIIFGWIFLWYSLGEQDRLCWCLSFLDGYFYGIALESRIVCIK